VGSGDDSNIVGPVPDLPFRRSWRGLVVGGDQVLLARHRIRDGGTVWLGLAAGPGRRETRCGAIPRAAEKNGLVITAAHAPRLVWV
jgi:hypothetical protein